MRRFDCICGHSFHDSDEALWRSYASFVLSPDELDRVGRDEDEYRELYVCPLCGLLALQRQPGSVVFGFYRKVGG